MTAIARQCIVAIDHCVKLIQTTFAERDLMAPDGKWCEAYAVVATQLAQMYLHDGRFVSAVRYFESAINVQRVREGDSWPSTMLSLDLLGGLTVAYQRSGNLDAAAEVATSALTLAEKICDETDLKIASLSTILKSIMERREVNLNHHKSTVLASRDAKSFPAHEGLSMSLDNLGDLLNDDFKETAESDENTEALRGASFDGDVGVVKLLLGLEGVEADAVDSTGRTPLSWAAEARHVPVVQLLLQTHQVDVNSKDHLGRTPLCWASDRGHETVVWSLLETHQVDVNTQDVQGRTPLIQAVIWRHVDIVKLLLSTGGIAVNTQERNGATALIWAASLGHEEIVVLLCQLGTTDMNVADYHRQTALSYAVANGRLAVVHPLLATKRVMINQQNSKGETALIRAVQKGNLHIVQQLILTQGIMIHIKDEQDRTALDWARILHRPDIGSLLSSWRRPISP